MGAAEIVSRPETVRPLPYASSKARRGSTLSCSVAGTPFCLSWPVHAGVAQHDGRDIISGGVFEEHDVRSCRDLELVPGYL